jgi:acetyltransferase
MSGRATLSPGDRAVIYTIPLYPVHLIDVVRLADGSRATIRPTLPQDLEAQRAFFRALSPEARYRRFMTRLDELPDELARRFASVDYRRHLALLAEVFEGGRQIMIGEARFVADPREADTCEFAVAVADGRLRLGIGRALVELLERAALAAGMRRMVGDTLAVNRAMIAFAARTGFSVSLNREDATMARLEKRLAASAAPLAA